MPRHKKTSNISRVAVCKATKDASFTLEVPDSVLQSCLQLRDGEQLKMAGSISSSTSHKVKVTGTKAEHVMSYIFQGQKNILNKFLKQTWKCALKDISGRRPSITSETQQRKRPAEEPLEPSSAKKPRGRPRKSQIHLAEQKASATVCINVASSELNTDATSSEVNTDVTSSHLKTSVEIMSEPTISTSSNNEGHTSFEDNKDTIQDLALPRISNIAAIKLESMDTGSEGSHKEVKVVEDHEQLKIRDLVEDIQEQESAELDNSLTSADSQPDESESEKIFDLSLVKVEEIEGSKYMSCPCCNNKRFKRLGRLKNHLFEVHGVCVSASPDDRPRMSRQALFQENHLACQKLGLVSEQDSIDSAAFCVICHRKFTGVSFKGRCLRHWEEKHKISRNKYSGLLQKSGSEKTDAIDKILQEEKISRNDHKFGDRSKANASQMVSCPGCKQYYTGMGNLVMHIKIRHKNQPDYQKILAQVEEIKSKNHEERMKNADTYSSSCCYCDVQRFGRGLIKHLKMVHSDEPNISQAIEQATTTCDELLKQRESIRKKGLYYTEKLHNLIFECPTCNDKFTSRAARGRHHKFSCKTNPNRIVDWIPCICSRRFKTPELLEAHKPNCMRAVRIINICDLCGKSFKYESGLYSHKNKVHHHVIKYTCQYCSKGFYDKSAHDAHVSMHTTDRNFLCDLCGKSFKNIFSVQKHKRSIHMNRYQYHCMKCGHGMQKRQYLDNHVCGRVRRVQTETEKALTAVRDQNTDDAGKIPTTVTNFHPDHLEQEQVPLVYVEVASDVWTSSTVSSLGSQQEYIIEQPAEYVAQQPVEYVAQQPAQYVAHYPEGYQGTGAETIVVHSVTK